MRSRGRRGGQGEGKGQDSGRGRGLTGKDQTRSLPSPDTAQELRPAGRLAQQSCTRLPGPAVRKGRVGEEKQTPYSSAVLSGPIQ